MNIITGDMSVEMPTELICMRCKEPLKIVAQSFQILNLGTIVVCAPCYVLLRSYEYSIQELK
jgi:hypothetical protein